MKTDNVVAETPGERLVIRAKELRGDRTLSEIAERIGMRQDDLGRIERGETQSIRYETLLKLCSVFNVTPDELFRVEPLDSRKPNPLERVLAGIEVGSYATHKVGPRVKKLRPTESIMDLDAAAGLSEFEEPVAPRRRKHVPSSASK